MSVTFNLELPDALANEAKASGLLESNSMTELISIELRRRKAAMDLGQVLDKIRDQHGTPMSLDEIQAEVKAVRAKRRAREARH